MQDVQHQDSVATVKIKTNMSLFMKIKNLHFCKPTEIQQHTAFRNILF